MRKFIVSDIHGFGNVYYSMMGYLDNVSKEEEVELYINGDLIDRGYESGEILLDVIKRIKENKFKIVYLGGNHELLMYENFLKRKSFIGNYMNEWYLNGGTVTDYYLEKLDGKKRKEIFHFISNLKIYYKFNEQIKGKPIVLCHAKCPNIIQDNCDMHIKQNNRKVFKAVWFREGDILFPLEKTGHRKYFSIIGHTPNNSKYGYIFDEKENYLNIDGGCAGFVTGNFKYNHFPLVEVKDNYLKILTFNSNNEIIYGNYFFDNKSYLYTSDELNKENSYLNNSLKMNEFELNEDDVIIYKMKKK